jgi:CBS domain-containing protein
VKIGDICEVNVTTVCTSATLTEAAYLLHNSYMDAIVAIASPVPRPTVLGIITYGQLLDALGRGNDLKSVRVLDVLDAHPLVLSEEEEIEGAIARLRARGRKHAPVTECGGTLRGLISMERLLGWRAVTLRARAAAVTETPYK